MVMTNGLGCISLPSEHRIIGIQFLECISFCRGHTMRGGAFYPLFLFKCMINPFLMTLTRQSYSIWWGKVNSASLIIEHLCDWSHLPFMPYVLAKLSTWPFLLPSWPSLQVPTVWLSCNNFSSSTSRWQEAKTWVLMCLHLLGFVDTLKGEKKTCPCHLLGWCYFGKVWKWCGFEFSLHDTPPNTYAVMVQ